MSAGTLYAMLGYFPLMMLVTSFEVRSMPRSRPFTISSIMFAVIVLYAAVASILGVSITLWCLWSMESGQEFSEWAFWIWGSAVASLVGAGLLAFTSAASWVFAGSLDKDTKSN